MGHICFIYRALFYHFIPLHWVWMKPPCCSNKHRRLKKLVQSVALQLVRISHIAKFGFRILMRSSNYLYVPIRSGLQWRVMGKPNDTYWVLCRLGNVVFLIAFWLVLGGIVLLIKFRVYYQASALLQPSPSGNEMADKSKGLIVFAWVLSFPPAGEQHIKDVTP